MQANSPLNEFKIPSHDWTTWSPNLKDLAPDTDAFDQELDLLDLSDLLTLPTDYNLGVNTELFTEIRGGYAPGPTSAITSSDSLNSCDTFDTLSAYSASESIHQYTTGLSNLSEVLSSFDFGTLALAETPATPTAVESAVDLQLRMLMEQHMEQQPPASLNPMTTVYPPASSHPSLTSTPVQLPTLPIAYTNARTSLSPIDDPAERGGDTDPRKKYCCPKCDRRFARAFNLKTHIATHDPNRVKSFKCRHAGCGRSFSRKHDLGRHLVSIHQDHDGPDAKPSIGINAGKGSKSNRIWCDTCGRGWVKGSGQECECSAEESSVGEHS